MLMSAVVILLHLLLGMHPGMLFLALGMRRHCFLGLMLKCLHLLAGHCHHWQSPASSASQQLPARHHMCQTQRGQSAPPSDLQNSQSRIARQPAEKTVKHRMPLAVDDCSTPHLWCLQSVALGADFTHISTIMQKQAEAAAALAPVSCLSRQLSRLRLDLVSMPVLHHRRLRLASASASVHAFLAVSYKGACMSCQWQVCTKQQGANIRWVVVLCMLPEEDSHRCHS